MPPMFGGYGYMAEYPIARMYAASRVQKIYGGANEVPERPGFEEAVNMSHTLHTLQMPLHGVRVVEFEGIGPGPLAARMLADMGAEVITLTRAEQALRRGGWAGRWRTRCAAARRSRSST